MRYPPLNALRAFEAAGRHESFLLAAHELNVSAASISRFIKILEQDLGQTLFIRQSSGVKLSQTGKDYLYTIAPVLQALATISQKFRQAEPSSLLQITTIPAIAETWLVSQLWRFQKRHKHIQINLTIDDKPFNFAGNDHAIWLTYCDGIMPNTLSFAMLQDRLALVCNQQIARRLKTPMDIKNLPFLVDIDWLSDWNIWLAAAKLSYDIDDSTINRVNFERYSMVVNAAIAGTGVAIGHTALLETYLQLGTLVSPFAMTALSDKQFYAVVEKNSPSQAVKDFIRWFSGEIID